ncbi:unnamed protein product [Closterium sp. Naga37s-1]|nr:unnamed protein product [Closterium sp. Naga37s-1]
MVKALEQHSTAVLDGLVARLATTVQQLEESRAAHAKLNLHSSAERDELAARLETAEQRLVESQVEEANLREEVKKKEAQVEQLVAVSKYLEERRAAEAQLREEVKEKAAQLQAQLQALSKELEELRGMKGVSVVIHEGRDLSGLPLVYA